MKKVIDGEIDHTKLFFIATCVTALIVTLVATLLLIPATLEILQIINESEAVGITTRS